MQLQVVIVLYIIETHQFVTKLVETDKIVMEPVTRKRLTTQTNSWCEQAVQREEQQVVELILWTSFYVLFCLSSLTLMINLEKFKAGGWCQTVCSTNSLWENELCSYWTDEAWNKFSNIENLCRSGRELRADKTWMNLLSRTLICKNCLLFTLSLLTHSELQKQVIA